MDQLVDSFFSVVHSCLEISFLAVLVFLLPSSSCPLVCVFLAASLPYLLPLSYVLCPRGLKHEKKNENIFFLISSHYLVDMRGGDKDDGTLLGDLVCTSGTDLSEEDVEEDGEEEGDKVIYLETHDCVYGALSVEARA